MTSPAVLALLACLCFSGTDESHEWPATVNGAVAGSLGDLQVSNVSVKPFEYFVDFKPAPFREIQAFVAELEQKHSAIICSELKIVIVSKRGEPPLCRGKVMLISTDDKAKYHSMTGVLTNLGSFLERHPQWQFKNLLLRARKGVSSRAELEVADFRQGVALAQEMAALIPKLWLSHYSDTKEGGRVKVQFQVHSQKTKSRRRL
ncbi:MAG: hypothetical protein V3T77_04215 [Planctomycetota bacterium]